MLFSYTVDTMLYSTYLILFSVGSPYIEQV